MKAILFLSLFLFSIQLNAFAQKDTVLFHVDLSERNGNKFKVQMELKVKDNAASLDLNMPVWTPGYYQQLDFGKKVSDFEVLDESNTALPWQKTRDDQWRIACKNSKSIRANYTVTTDRPFVAIPYIDAERAFIRPTGVFIYPEKNLDAIVIVKIKEMGQWDKIATGLDSIAPNTYIAKHFDILYDSPILVGNLTELPRFNVGGKEHRFLGYQMADFDKDSFIKDIERIVISATSLFGDIPYDHYTFIGLGKGNGGIEQLNSTAIAFTGEGLDNPDNRLRTLSFIAHEYFHHYNVKRIRPIELGPFDYSRPNRTNGLWLSEGLTVYYENLILKNAGLLKPEQGLEDWQNTIQGYENNAGRKKQTLVQSSWNTWEDGPFGKRGETISFYEKGPIIGMFLDLAIRNASKNKKSLNDVMRALYYNFYKENERGATEAEIKMTCESIAGQNLDEIFSYIQNLDDLDYQKYLAMAGIQYQKSNNADGKSSIKLSIQPQLSTLQKEILNDIFGY